MAKSDVEVRIKMSPLQAGKMYMENINLKKKIKKLEAEKNEGCPNLIEGICELTGENVWGES